MFKTIRAFLFTVLCSVLALAVGFQIGSHDQEQDQQRREQQAQIVKNIEPIPTPWDN